MTDQISQFVVLIMGIGGIEEQHKLNFVGVGGSTASRPCLKRKEEGVKTCEC